MIVSRPLFRFAKAVLVLAGVFGASAAVAIPIFRTNLTNGSQQPLLGLELVTVEAGSSTPSARTPIHFEEAVLPGKTTRVSETMDPAVAARGGQQQLRWYWTSDRTCWGYLVAQPSSVAGGANTGARVCEGGKVPVATSPGERMAMVDTYEARGDTAAAQFELAGLLADYPGQSQLFHRRGELYLRMGNDWAAEKAFRAETDVDLAHGYHHQALLQFARGEGYAALESLNSAVREAPGNIQYLGDRANLSCLAGDLEQTRKDEAAIVALGGPKAPPRGADCQPVQ